MHLPAMRLIDAHVHLYPPEVNRDPAGWAAAHGELHWAALCTRRRRNGRPVQGFPGVDGLLRAMDAAGIAQAVLLGWYWEQAENCASQNRFYTACVRAHPDRLAAFATVQPRAGEAAVRAEILRAHAEGLIGLGELSPHAQGHAVDDPVFAAALALATELKLPVNLHVTDPAGRRYPGRVETPLEDFRRLARMHPATTFILAHWGGGLPFLGKDPEVRRDLAQVYYDTAASPLLYDQGIWRRALDGPGAARVLFGSDFPLTLYPGEQMEPDLARLLAEARGAGLSAAEQAAVLGGNAARVLGL
jgi:predicted TIM-barrel fold metal-dependent hydrolase